MLKRFRAWNKQRKEKKLRKRLRKFFEVYNQIKNKVPYLYRMMSEIEQLESEDKK